MACAAAVSDALDGLFHHAEPHGYPLPPAFVGPGSGGGRRVRVLDWGDSRKVDHVIHGRHVVHRLLSRESFLNMKLLAFPRVIKPGFMFAVPLSEGSHGLAQMAEGGDYAFFDVQLTEDQLSAPTLEAWASSPVAFRVPLAKGVPKAGAWRYLGSAPLQHLLAVQAAYWSRPVGSKDVSVILNNQFMPGTQEDMLRLECMAWWMEDHVRQRLLDHFAGRPNLVVDGFRNRP